MQLSIEQIGYSDAQLDKLELYRQLYGLPNIEAAIEQANRRQIEHHLYAMTGIKAGPKLVINNTAPSARSVADDDNNKPT